MNTVAVGKTMNPFTVGQRVTVISIALGGRMDYRFHDYVGPHNPNHHAEKPRLAELECIDEGKFAFVRWFDPDQMTVYSDGVHNCSGVNSYAEAVQIDSRLNSGPVSQMSYFKGFSEDHDCLNRHWLLADDYVQHLAWVVDQAVVDEHPNRYSIESYFRKIREMVLLFKDRVTPVSMELGGLTIPVSRFQAFCKDFVESNNGRRWGQAFYDYMQAHKCQQDKWWWDRLYNADNAFARSMVKAMLDHNN
jgi:hypothetical protein